MYCKDGNCASTQIPAHRKVLADIHSTKDEKRFAIFVLTHMIGDIHQPLHGADNDDRGGNEIKVSRAGSTDKKLNLHSVWDTDLVERLFRGKNEVTVAKGLVAKFASKAEGWKSGTVRDWVGESNQLAIDIAYGKLPTFACGKDVENKRIRLTEAYLDDHSGRGAAR